MTAPRFPIAPGEAQRWTELGHQIRMAGFMLRRCPAPASESPFHVADELFSLRPVSMTLRRMLTAAHDHLGQWSDLVTPTRVFDGQEALVSPRPVFSYARSGMEAAGAVAWVLELPDICEGVKRHQRVTYWDLAEQKKACHSVGDSEGAAVVEERMGALAKHVFDGKAPPKVAYVERVKAGARLAGLDEDRADYLWRLASAASHGQEWFYDDAFEPVAEEDGSGHRPRGEQMVDVLEHAASMLTCAMVRFVENCGFEPADAIAEAYVELTETVQLRNGATPASLQESARVLAALREQTAEGTGQQKG